MQLIKCAEFKSKYLFKKIRCVNINYIETLKNKEVNVTLINFSIWMILIYFHVIQDEKV